MTLAQGVCSPMGCSPARSEPGGQSQGLGKGEEMSLDLAVGQQMMQLERRLQQRSQVCLGDRAGDETGIFTQGVHSGMSYLECRAEAHPRGQDQSQATYNKAQAGTLGKGCRGRSQVRLVGAVKTF